jgi:hypothetical protein
MTADIDRHPRFRRLADYLASKAQPGKLPGRQHIEPLDIPDLLPHLMLIDVVPQPGGRNRYRVRLVGTAAVAIQGSDATGKFADEILTAPQGGELVEGYDEIVRTRQPQYRHGVVATPGRDHVEYERIAFPLAADGEHVDMLVFVFVQSQG